MPKIAVDVDLAQIEKIIQQLKTRDRITLIRRLEQKTWGERFRSTTARIDSRRKKFPVSRKQVLQLVKQARRERYASRRS